MTLQLREQKTAALAQPAGTAEYLVPAYKCRAQNSAHPVVRIRWMRTELCVDRLPFRDLSFGSLWLKRHPPTAASFSASAHFQRK
jgi:hypothetical protein